MLIYNYCFMYIQNGTELCKIKDKVYKKCWKMNKIPIENKKILGLPNKKFDYYVRVCYCKFIPIVRNA